MERIIGKEYMKMAILKHEETFKEQVCELHRLYQIQTKLMKNVQANRPADDRQVHRAIHKKDTRIDLEIPAEEYIQAEGIPPENNEDDHMEIELTLGLGSYYSHVRKAAETTPLTSDSGLASYSSSSSGSSRSMKAGWGSHSHPNRKKRKAWEDLQESMKDQLIQQEKLQHSAWLFQVLSL